MKKHHYFHSEWCWRRLLRVLWTARRSNQLIWKSIPNIHWKYCCWNSNTLSEREKNLMLEKIESQRRRGQQRKRWLNSITNSMDTNLSKLWEMVGFPGSSFGKESTWVDSQETWVWFLEDPLEKGTATHSCIFAWKIPRDRGAWPATVHGVAKSRTGPRDFHFHFLGDSGLPRWLRW